MTSSDADGKLQSIWQRMFHGRSPGPLLGPWIACTVIGGGIFFTERKLPVFHEVVQPIYFVLAVILIIATARWVRARESGNRRHADRRHGDRREKTKSD